MFLLHLHSMYRMYPYSTYSNYYLDREASHDIDHVLLIKEFNIEYI